MLDIQDLMQTDGRATAISMCWPPASSPSPAASMPASCSGCSPSCSNSCPRWDPEKPVLVFFFDEAHLLFKDAPRALLEKN